MYVLSVPHGRCRFQSFEIIVERFHYGTGIIFLIYSMKFPTNFDYRYPFWGTNLSSFFVLRMFFMPKIPSGLWRASEGDY
jgi:hypothetical protein